MSWWQSQKSIRKGGGGPAAPATATTGIGGSAGEVAVQKVYHNLVPKTTFNHGAGKLRKIDSIKEDINKKADRFIKMTKERLFKQTKSFRQPAGSPAAAAVAGRDGKLF
uniref:Uncharacterized protein n=1 Tax=Oryza punctata TaxID=4537 RepID=A0A0E0KYB6_ORYPU